MSHRWSSRRRQDISTTIVVARVEDTTRPSKTARLNCLTDSRGVNDIRLKHHRIYQRRRRLRKPNQRHEKNTAGPPTQLWDLTRCKLGPSSSSLGSMCQVQSLIEKRPAHNNSHRDKTSPKQQTTSEQEIVLLPNFGLGHRPDDKD